MYPGIGPLGEALGAYAVVSMVAIPFALGAGLDERAAGAISISIGIVTASVLLTWRYLPQLYRRADSARQ